MYNERKQKSKNCSKDDTSICNVLSFNTVGNLHIFIVYTSICKYVYMCVIQLHTQM